MKETDYISENNPHATSDRYKVVWGTPHHGIGTDYISENNPHATSD
jgi:hypothetical protein